MGSTSLKEYIDQIKLADTHEHLIAESLRNNQRSRFYLSHADVFKF